MQEFARIRSCHESQQIKLGVVGTENKILQEIVDQETGMCDLNKLSDIVDLFTYLPNRDKATSQLVSSNIMDILSPTHKSKEISPSKTSGSNLSHLMELIWGRI
mmetsp:Transcript_3254/g.4392  ORF Transcript_3254/g.4392 Transcript_3254/m.4392 type:complete len:104 (+) Transcript_3254:452-763(+)